MCLTSVSGCPQVSARRPPQPTEHPVARPLHRLRHDGSSLTGSASTSWTRSVLALVRASTSITRHRRPHSFESVPRVPVGMRYPVRGSLCAACFARSRGIFQLTGLSTEIAGRPQKFLFRPLVVHRFVHRRRHHRVDVRYTPGHTHRHVFDVVHRSWSHRHHPHSIAHVVHPRALHGRPPGRLLHFPRQFPLARSPRTGHHT